MFWTLNVLSGVSRNLAEFASSPNEAQCEAFPEDSKEVREQLSLARDRRDRLALEAAARSSHRFASGRNAYRDEAAAGYAPVNQTSLCDVPYLYKPIKTLAVRQSTGLTSRIVGVIPPNRPFRGTECIRPAGWVYHHDLKGYIDLRGHENNSPPLHRGRCLIRGRDPTPKVTFLHREVIKRSSITATRKNIRYHPITVPTILLSILLDPHVGQPV